MKKRNFYYIYISVILLLSVLYLCREEFFYSVIAILYTFSQLVLSDTFLSVYNITINDKNELQNSRLQISNISISFLITKLIFSLCHISTYLDNKAMHNAHNYLEFEISHASQIFVVILGACFIWYLLEIIEKFIAKGILK